MGLFPVVAAGSANQPRRHVTAWALVLMLGLVVGADNSHAATLIWTNGDDYWQSTTAWTTNLIPNLFEFPIKPHRSRANCCKSELVTGWSGLMESPMRIRSIKPEGGKV